MNSYEVDYFYHATGMDKPDTTTHILKGTTLIDAVDVFVHKFGKSNREWLIGCLSYKGTPVRDLLNGEKDNG